MEIREARPADAPALGEVHVRAWQEGYRGGLMPDDFLAALSVEDRVRWWESVLEQPPMPPSGRLVAVDAEDRVVGHVIFGPAGEKRAGGRVYSLNVHPDAWGRGFGRGLLEAATRALTGEGFTRAILWVHTGNRRARRFYEAAGWRCDDIEQTEEVHGVEVTEVRYSIDLGSG